jgi:hypothetical protein
VAIEPQADGWRDERGAAMARSWRNEGLPPVPERVQRQRILTVLAERWNTGYFDGVGMSSLGERAFAGRRFSRAQGAALAVSRTVRRMYDEGLLSPAGFGQHGYRITSKRALQRQRLAVVRDD